MKSLRFYCEIPGCKKCFRSEDALKSHAESDHKSKNVQESCEFKCPNCSKILSTKQSLREHSYTHSGERPYKCLEAGCGLLFRQSSQLSNHKKTHIIEKKKRFERATINLSFLSTLLSNEKSCILAIPSEPLNTEYITLPEIYFKGANS